MNLTRGINMRKIAEGIPGASGAEAKVQPSCLVFDLLRWLASLLSVDLRREEFPFAGRLHRGGHVRITRAARPRDTGGLRNGCRQGTTDCAFFQLALPVKPIHNRARISGDAERLGQEHVFEKALQVTSPPRLFHLFLLVCSVGRLFSLFVPRPPFFTRLFRCHFFFARLFTGPLFSTR